MTRSQGKPAVSAVKDVLLQNPDAFREIVQAVVQEMLEAELEEVLGAGMGERTEGRLG
jgi:transposase-like protein